MEQESGFLHFLGTFLEDDLQQIGVSFCRSEGFSGSEYYKKQETADFVYRSAAISANIWNKWKNSENSRFLCEIIEN